MKLDEFLKVADEITADDVGKLASFWHGRYIRELAHDAMRAMMRGEIADRERLNTWIDETTDGSERSIYTWLAQYVVAASANSDAYEDEIGEQPENDSIRAAWAMRADLAQRIRAEFEFPDDEAWNKRELAWIERIGPDADDFEPLTAEVVYCCAECGSTAIESTAWIDYNTAAIVDGEPPTSDVWCPICETHETDTVDVEQWKREHPEREPGVVVDDEQADDNNDDDSADGAERA